MSKILTIQGKKIKIWPKNQLVEKFIIDPLMVITDFNDTDHYHKNLTKRLQQMEKRKELFHKMEIGGSKISHCEKWCPESKVVYERAKAYFKAVTGHNCKVQLSWASIYHNGDYITPHSHTDSDGTIVYMVEPGEPESKEHPNNGKFSITDPRIPSCCSVPEMDRVIQTFTPEMKAGSMVLIPAPIMHHVQPYFGDRPRITIAFNMKIIG